MGKRGSCLHCWKPGSGALITEIYNVCFPSSYESTWSTAPLVKAFFIRKQSACKLIPYEITRCQYSHSKVSFWQNRFHLLSLWVKSGSWFTKDYSEHWSSTCGVGPSGGSDSSTHWILASIETAYTFALLFWRNLFAGVHAQETKATMSPSPPSTYRELPQESKLRSLTYCILEALLVREGIVS